MADRRREFVRAVVAAVGGVAREFEEDGAICAEWTNGDLAASVEVADYGSCVALADAKVEVGSTREAAQILKMIFADEIVAVGAWAKGTLVYTGLQRADDPGAGFGSMDGIPAGDMPRIDRVEVWRWSEGVGDLETGA